MARIEAANAYLGRNLEKPVSAVERIILETAELPLLPEWQERPYATTPEFDDQVRLINSEQQIAIRLAKLNTPLIEHNLPLFNSVQLTNIDARATDALSETEHVSEVGGGQCLAIVKTDKLITDPETKKQKLGKGMFAPVIEKEDYHKENGARYLVLTDTDQSLPDGKVRGEIQIPTDLFKATNDQLQAYGRVTLPESLEKSKPKGENTVVDVRFSPDKEKYPVFYDNYHIVMTLKTAGGQEIPMVLNKIKSGKQGEVYTVRYTDKTWGFVLNTRPLIGNVLIEIPRGFASEKFGGEFEQETGLDFSKAVKTIKSVMRQDYAVENVGSQFFAVVLDASEKMDPKVEAFRDEKQHELESLTPARLSTLEVLKFMEKGYITDSFTLAGFGIAALTSGELTFNNKDYRGDRYIVFEDKFIPQIGRKALVFPEGPIGKGRNLAEILRNTGISPTAYSLERGGMDILVGGRKYIKVHINDALEMLKRGEFDNITASSLVRGLVGIHALVEADYK